MTQSKFPRFSERTLQFIRKASRQKKKEWLEKNREEYDEVLLGPLKHLAGHLKKELASSAAGYHFPQKGIGRLRRSANRALETGFLYKDWISYSASRPSGSRFDHNPSIFFMINPDDEDGETVLVAGGLYMPSSRQLRAIREAIAEDASAFDELFASKAFRASFKGGFSDERISTRSPRGFDPAHPRMNWLRLQGFFVWRSYLIREFSSSKFPELIVQDTKQILRLNALLESAIQGKLKQATVESKPSRLLARLDELKDDFKITQRKMDF